MKKLLLLLTMSLTLTSFALNNSNKNIPELEDSGTCIYSINTYWSDGSVTTETYITTTSTKEECELTAQAHVLRLASN